MGKLAEFVRTFAAPRKLPPPGGATDSWAQWRYSLPRERSYLNDVGDGSGSSLVVPAIDFIANGFIEAPVEVLQRRDGEWQTVSDHGMTEIIETPNPHYSGALMWMATIASWIADGNAYWVITEFSSAGRPATLYWVPHWTIEPKDSEDGTEFITHYRYEPGIGRSGFNVPVNQVIHFRWGLDPQNPRKGYSRLKSVLRQIYTDEEAQRFVATLLRNVGVPGLVLSPKGDVTLTEDQAKEVKRDIIQKTTGDRRGEPLVMLSETTTDTYGFSPEQMALADVFAIPESRVPAVVGIPAAVLGFLAGMEQTKVGATMEELREQGFESGVVPKMRLFSADLKTQFLPHYTDEPKAFRVRFDLSEVRVLQEDENKRNARELEALKAGGQTVEEYRARTGRKPELPPGDTLMIPVNVSPVPVGTAQPLVTEQPNQPQLSRSYAMARKASREQIAYLRQSEKAGQSLTTRFAGEVEKAFDELGQQAAAAWEALPQKFVADPSEDPIVAAIIEALALEEWRFTRLSPLWRTHYLRTAELTYDALRANLALEIGVNLPDPVGQQVVAAGGRNLGLVDLDASTRRALFEALAEAREEGLGPVEAARRIRRYVGAGRFTAMEQAKAGSGVRYRAELIARTETLHAQRVAVAESGKAAGFTHYLAFDNRTGFGDEECVARDGATFTYEEMLAESASEHPNGTLSFAPVPEMAIAARGAAREITHVVYGEDGRISRTLKEIVSA